MDRRDFLKGVTAAGAATAIASEARAAPPPAWSTPASGAADMERFLEQFDRGLQAIDGDALGGGLAALLPGGQLPSGPGAAEGQALFRRSLRTLYAAGAFGELSPADQLHPGVQARMWREVPSIEATIDAHRRLLGELGPAEHARVQEALRRDPGLPLRLSEALEDAALQHDLAPSRRGRLRLAATEIATRLRSQPPSLLVGEYLGKVQRMRERDGDVGSAERALMARLGENAFWEYRAFAEREALAWRARLDGQGAADGDADDPSAVPRSKKTALSALKTLGIGVVVGGLSGLAASGGAEVMIFGVTVGVILVLTGLVMLLVAAIQRIAEHAQDKLDEDGRLRPEYRIAPASLRPAGPPKAPASEPAAVGPAVPWTKPQD